MRTSPAIIALYLAVLGFFPLSGQTNDISCLPNIFPEGTREFLEKQQFSLPYSCSDTSQYKYETHLLLQQLQLAGYLEAAIDSIRGQNLYLHLGPLYAIQSIRLDTLPKPWLEDRNIRRILQNKQQQSTADQIHALVQRAANIGYPFAFAEISQFVPDRQKAILAISVQSGPFVRMAEMQLPGEAIISTNFLSRYLGLEPGTPYNQNKILSIAQKIEDLGFITLNKAPELGFTNDTCIPVLDPKPTPFRNNFDFIIGVIPQSNSGRLLLTASLRAALNNTLGKGESIRFNFERLRPETQALELAMTYPYILELPLGTDLQFNLYKRDSSYLDVFGELGLQYLLSGNNLLRVFWKQHRSNLIQAPQRLPDEKPGLPASLDILHRSFGLGFSFRRLDYVFNPRKGLLLNIRGNIGNRKIVPNSRVEENGYSNLYKELDLNTLRYQLAFEASWYLPLFSQSTLKLAVDSRLIAGKGENFRNEQFRIGGNRLLRGFDEESLFASRYLVFTLEYRLLIDKNAYLAAFGDWAKITDDSTLGYSVDYPLGLGAGISFQTSAGRFQLNLAYGKIGTANWDLSNPRIHFGYVSLF